MAKIDLEFDGFSALSVRQSIDTAADEFKLDMLQTDGIKEIFAPRNYTPVKLAVGSGETFLTGRVLAVSANLSAAGMSVAAQGAGDAIVLAQSTLPAIQLNNQSLYDIVNFVASKFDLCVRTEHPMPHIARAACDTGTNAFEFLNGLCKDHNFLLYSAPDGALIINKQDPDLDSAVVLSEGDLLGAEISMSFDGTKMSRHYVAHGQSDGQDIFARYEYKSVPFYCIKHISVQEAPAQKIRWQLLRDNIEAYSLTINISRWESPKGDYWRKGQIVKLDYPKMWLSGYFRARSIEFKLSNNDKSTSLTLERLLEE